MRLKPQMKWNGSDRMNCKDRRAPHSPRRHKSETISQIEIENFCPGCNARAIVFHVCNHYDLIRAADGEPVMYGLDDDPTVIYDFGILAVRHDPETATITVTSYGREVFQMTPKRVERDLPGAWRETLASIAADLDAKFGRVRRMAHPGETESVEDAIALHLYTRTYALTCSVDLSHGEPKSADDSMCFRRPTQRDRTRRPQIARASCPIARIAAARRPRKRRHRTWLSASISGRGCARCGANYERGR